ncbi:MAG: hypothetical protein GXY33_02840 [Phycisphaerae bacterium]|nr:hypothetical protein [Phycisphaerae bacterium]
MFDNLSDMTVLEKIYAFTALIGGIAFAIRLVMQFVGAFGDVGDLDLDPGDGGFEVHDADTDMSFKLLSIQGLTAFFLMFGLVGLALLRASHVSEGWSLVGAVIAGLGMVWLLSQMFKQAKKLQSSGTINPQRAVGEQGTVYLSIAAGETGKVQIRVQGRLRIMNAVAENHEQIATGEQVRVVRVLPGSILVVDKTN